MSALDETIAFPAYALIRLRGAATVTLLGGTRDDLELLSDIPLEAGPPPPHRRFDRLACVPFRQVRERGYAVHDDGTPLSVITVGTETEVPLADLLGQLPDVELATHGGGGFDTADDDYARIVDRVIRDEIGRGEGANLVVGRTYRTTFTDWGHAQALTVFRRLLERERGAYWTFCVFTGDRWLIGASPERHVSVRAGEVRMNPISGTFRLRGRSDPAQRKEELLRFLADEKEIYELFMVVDEELKMMCDICDQGEQVLGVHQV
jgi:phenazine biosynthesis protein phzE